MPLPKRNKGQTKEDFIGKCIAKLAAEYPNKRQRAAICYQIAKK